MLPTVQIVSPVSDDNPLGFVVINESDFNPDVHEPFGADPESAKPLGIAALREALTAAGVEFNFNTKKAELQALLDQHLAQ